MRGTVQIVKVGCLYFFTSPPPGVELTELDPNQVPTDEVSKEFIFGGDHFVVRISSAHLPPGPDVPEQTAAVLRYYWDLLVEDGVVSGPMPDPIAVDVPMMLHTAAAMAALG